MERYIIVERYADNGELSHRALVDSIDGRELGTDGGEPEDQSFWRDWAWVPDELNKAQVTVEALQREVANLKACQCDGCAETLEENDVYCEKCWTRQQTALDAEREKVKGQSQRAEYAEGKVRELLLKQDALELKLSRLQTLVREAASAPGKDWLEWQLKLGEALDATPSAVCPDCDGRRVGAKSKNEAKTEANNRKRIK